MLPENPPRSLLNLGETVIERERGEEEGLADSVCAASRLAKNLVSRQLERVLMTFGASFASRISVVVFDDDYDCCECFGEL